MRVQNATDRLIETVRAQLCVPAEAAAHVADDLRENLESTHPPPDEVDRLTRRLKRGPRLAWTFALLGLVAACAAFFGGMKTFGWFEDASYWGRLVIPLHGTERLKISAWLEAEGSDANARAWLEQEPKNLMARELWLSRLPPTATMEEVQRMVAESEALDPGNGIYRLHSLLWRDRIYARIIPMSEIDLLNRYERIESRLDDLQEEVYALARNPHDQRGANERAYLFLARSEQMDHYQGFESMLNQLVAQMPDGHRVVNARGIAKLAGFPAGLTVDFTGLPESILPITEGSGYHGEARRALIFQSWQAGKWDAALHQMAWAAMDRRMAIFAAGGLIGLMVILCFTPLLRGKVVHDAGNSMQWIMPARDHFLAAGGALVLTVATAIAILHFAPQARASSPRSELDLYFYAPLAALFLLLVFTFTAALLRHRARALDWSRHTWLWGLLAVPIALASLWAQFAWRAQPRLDLVNVSAAGLFGLIVMSGLMVYSLGDSRHSLARAVLIKQLVKSLIAASLLMGAAAFACHQHELYWGTRDRFLGTSHGRPGIFQLRDQLLEQSRAFQQQALDSHPR